MKSSNLFVETFTPHTQIFIFEEQLCMSNRDFIFDTDQKQRMQGMFDIPEWTIEHIWLLLTTCEAETMNGLPN